jgi:hypothetical protein
MSDALKDVSRRTLTAGDRERADILGVCVSAINMEDAVALIEHWIATRTPTYVCITASTASSKA